MNSELNQKNKQLVWDFWQQLDQALTSNYQSITKSFFRPDVQWFGFDPINNLSGSYALPNFSGNH